MIGVIVIGLLCGVAGWDLFYSKPKGVSVSCENPDSKALQALKFLGMFLGMAIVAFGVMFLLILVLGNKFVFFMAVLIAWVALRVIRKKRGNKW